MSPLSSMSRSSWSSTQTLIRRSQWCASSIVPSTLASPVPSITQPGSLSPSPHPPMRWYGTRSVTRGSGPRIKRELPAELAFTPNDIPSVADWEAKRKSLDEAGLDPGATLLDAQGCLTTATRFVKAIVKAVHTWRSARALDLGFSPAELFYMACLLRSPPFGVPAALNISKQMLASAAEAGHARAIISMASLGLNEHLRKTGGDKRRNRSLPSASEAPELARIVQRFVAFLKTDPTAGTDPDALTVAGLLALASGDDALATKRLLEAVEVGNAGAGAEAAGTARKPRWDMEAQALLTLGALHKRAGRLDEARTVFTTVALELDVPEACLHLALLLVNEREKKLLLLVRAAGSGMVGALRPLAAAEKELAASAGEKAGRVHELMAREWEVLGTAAKAAGV